MHFRIVQPVPDPHRRRSRRDGGKTVRLHGGPEREKPAQRVAAQVIIRWHIQKGFSVVPGSSNPQHIQENIEVFDFELSDAEMAKMASLNQEKRYFNMTYQQIKDWMENYETWD